MTQEADETSGGPRAASGGPEPQVAQGTQAPPPTSPPDPAGSATGDAGIDEDGVDLSDLEAPGGMGAALDAIRARDPDPSPEELEAIRRTPVVRRNPWLAGLVVLLGAAVLWSMWADFRFWLRRAPEDLGSAAELFENGSFKARYDNRWVRVRGTPDVQHAARIEVKDQTYGYLRLREGGGSLFAMVPREDERRDDRFDGVFEGRMRRLDRSRYYEQARTFFEAERITSTVDLDVDALVEQFSGGGEASGGVVGVALAVDDPEGAGGKVRPAAADLLRVVVQGEVVKLQLGVATWPEAEAADAAVEALGYPFVRLEAPTRASDRPGAKLRRRLYHSYLVAAPADAREGIAGRLDAAAGVTPGGADPKVGSAVLPQQYTYVVPADRIELGAGTLSFEHEGNTTPPPHEVVGGELVPRALEQGRLRLAAGEISALRLEQQIALDPQGYVIVVEETPEQQRKWALLFMVVAVVVGLNALALVVRWRRSARRG